MDHLTAENFDVSLRIRLLSRFREYYDNGYRDLELLYLGARYAISLGRDEEGRTYLDTLENTAFQDGVYTTAYAPIGLLYLQILKAEDPFRKEVISRLSSLSERNGKLGRLFKSIDLSSFPLGIKVPPFDILTNLDQNRNGHRDYYLRFFSDSDKTTQQETGESALVEIQRLSRLATQAYENRDLSTARFSLENMLLLDGDQPDALRNLIIVAGEQKDIEAYERYWKRFVKVSIWRIVRGDQGESARQELIRFYSKVADATERDLSGTDNEILVALRRPGLLTRWLEARTALIWLSSIQETRREDQTHLDFIQMSAGRLGLLALMAYWIKLFHPEFSAYLDYGNISEQPEEIHLQRTTAVQKTYILRFLISFIKWGKIRFALKNDDEQNHREIVTALTGCAARIPFPYYLVELAKQMREKEERQEILLCREYQQACSVSIYEQMSALLAKEDWNGIANLTFDPDVEEALSPNIRLFRALGYCRTRRIFEGYQKAYGVLPELTEEDFLQGREVASLWKAILTDVTFRTIELDDKKTPGERDYRDATNSLKSCLTKESLRHLGNKPQELIELLQSTLMQISEKQELIKSQSLEPVNSALEQIKAKRQMESMLERVKEHISNEDFDKARKVVESLPNTPKALQEIKKSYLQQIDEVEETSRIRKQIEKSIEKAKTHIIAGRFEDARGEVRKIPQDPEEARDMRKQLLKQIDDLEVKRNQALKAIPPLMDKLRMGGVDQYKVYQLARDNNISLEESPEQFYELLKVIEKQIGY